MSTNLQTEVGVLSSLDGHVNELINRHIAAQRLWFPSELVAKEGSIEVSPETSAMLVLNMITEEGLPSFHRLLATHIGEAGHWVTWTDLWTAEEDRHGAALRDVLRRTSGVDMVMVERLQYDYLRAGFRPHWHQGPYQLLAYTTLQERATQISHNGVSVLAGKDALELRKVLGHIAGEEQKHCRFYKSVFKLVVENDTTRALEALLSVIQKFVMPGSSIPDFPHLAYMAMRLDVFSTTLFRDIVLETIDSLKLHDLSGLDERGARALKSILRVPAILARKEAAFRKAPVRELSFEFLPGVTFKL